jgi:UDP-N-acetylmuramate: L-alanyl-gamma-D-glutamyl-meso-diaminopimelate ligase
MSEEYTQALTSEEIKSRQRDFSRIFFYRICGTGMGSCAVLLKEYGLHVEGSDVQFFPPMGDYLNQTGIKLHLQDDVTPEFLKSFDLIVVGNVVPKDSEQAKLIESLNMPYASFPQVLGGLLLKNKQVFGVAGTHGKTTTCYFLLQILEQIGKKPGYLIGGVIDERPSSKVGEDDIFIIESDEYDSAYFDKVSKFRHYEIDNLIVTSLEFDHGDIFSSLDDIKDEFRVLLDKVPGAIVYSAQFPELINLVDEFKDQKNLSSIGTKENPQILKMGPEGTVFTMDIDEVTEEFSTNVIGIHNIHNIASCLSLCLKAGISKDQLKMALGDLKMVRRRQEERGYFQEALVIDDFAHHPTAVRVTLEMIKTKYPGLEVVCLFAPSSATARSSLFQNEFTNSLLVADILLIAKPEKDTTIKKQGNLDVHLMKEVCESSGKTVELIENLDDILRAFEHYANKNRIIVVLNNGPCFGLWKSEVIKNLK